MICHESALALSLSQYLFFLDESFSNKKFWKIDFSAMEISKSKIQTGLHITGKSNLFCGCDQRIL